MVRIRSALAALAALVSGSGAAGAAEPAAAPPKQRMDAGGFKGALEGADAAEMDLAGLLRLLNQGPVVLLDVRSKESFERLHVKGAVNLPLTELTEKTLPKVAPGKDVPVAIMCDYSLEPVRMIAMTFQAYPVLKANGYSRIYRLNFWMSHDGKMLNRAEMEKVLTFEGSELPPKK